MAHSALEFSKNYCGTRLLACPECDLVQCEPRRALRAGTVNCVRCGATLYRCAPHSLDATLAFAIAVAALFLVAIGFPVMTLDLQGIVMTESLFGMAAALAHAGMPSVGALVFITVILMPALEIGALLWMLMPLKAGFVPRGMSMAARIHCAVRPWAMVEVLMLAALVSIGRLQKQASLELGLAFWSLVAMMLLFAVIDSLFDPRDVWTRVDALRGRR